MFWSGTVVEGRCGGGGGNVLLPAVFIICWSPGEEREPIPTLIQSNAHCNTNTNTNTNTGYLLFTGGQEREQIPNLIQCSFQFQPLLCNCSGKDKS